METSSWDMLLRTAGSLAVVLALIAVLAWAAKKFMRPEVWGSSLGKGIRVVHSHQLTPKASLMVVEVEDRRLVLGVAGETVSSICELPSEKAGLEAVHG